VQRIIEKEASWTTSPPLYLFLFWAAAVL
jgi:hypothetical protein